MKAVILCGGQGTRIRDASELIPKPMLTIGQQPILWHIMMAYASHGVTEFVLCLGYKGWHIKEYFLNYQAMACDITLSTRDSSQVHYHDGPQNDWTVTLAETGLHTMTGGRLLAVRKYLDDGPFCLTYGDGLADLDIQALLDFHRRSGKVATLSLIHI